MVIPAQSKKGCKQHRILFTEEMDRAGRDAIGNDFLQHVEFMAKKKESAKWSFNQDEAQQDANNKLFIEYRKSWD